MEVGIMSRKTILFVLCVTIIIMLFTSSGTLAAFISDETADMAEINNNSDDELESEDVRNQELFMSAIGLDASNCACIMQGNTNEENDCLAFYNGLKRYGGYGDVNIVNYGWTRTNSGGSYINTDRVTPNQYVWGGRYTVSYYSGHGSNSGGYPNLNVYASNSSGNYTPFNVAATLGVAGSDWRTKCVWKTGEYYSRVHILAACKQLDSSIMKYYARAMRASDMRVIAGYHETGPGHPTDVAIANKFMELAGAGNSVWYSWQYANQQNTVHPWAVLVYRENSNQYYRIPGFPGKTYATPSSSAAIYRYASHLGSNYQPVPLNTSKTISKKTSDYISSLPLYIATSDNKLVSTKLKDLKIEKRETIDTDDNVPIDTTKTNNIMRNILDEKDLDNVLVSHYPIVRCEVDPDVGHVKGTDVVVQRIYKYYNTYNNIRINNSFIEYWVDIEGISTVIDNWKDATPKMGKSDYISLETAKKQVAKAGYEEFGQAAVELVYQPVNDGLCKLHYEFISPSGSVAYVDAEAGSESN